MTINCNGKLLDLSRPKVMAILNITHDSFYDGGLFLEEKKWQKKIDTLLETTPDIIDIGGQSTRPGAKLFTAEQEWEKIIKPLEYIFKQKDSAIVSIDTFWAINARKAVDIGVSIINDISAGTIDDTMFDTVAELQKPYILMHIKGTPKNMQNNPHYDNVILEVNSFFSDKLYTLKKLGLNDIILDVGFGFGKNLDHNYTLLNNLSLMGFGDYPLLVGISRKSMAYKPIQANAAGALNASSVLHLKALQQGAKVLRVHDVQEAKEVITLYEFMNENEKNI